MQLKLFADRKLTLVLIVSLFALLINAGSYGVRETSDARYAEISREMLESGDYLNPTLLGIYHYHKPPLTYQITAFSYSLFGVNPFGARFFLQIALLIQMLLVYKLSFLLFKNRQSALWASLIYFSFPIALDSTRNLTTDPYLATFIIASLYSWVKYRKSGITGFLYLFTLCLALGFLSKGPVVFIVPVLFIPFFNRILKNRKGFNIHHIFAWLLFTAIAGSWFVYLIQKNPDFFNYFIGYHTIDRFAIDVFDRSKPFWYFFAIAPVFGIPWLLVLPFLLWGNKKELFNKTIYQALFAGIVLPIIFFSIASSKLVPYILPIFSLIAILTAQLFFQEQRLNKAFKNIVLGTGALLAIIFIVSPFLPIGIIIPKSIALMGAGIVASFLIMRKLNSIEEKSKIVYFSFIVSAVFLITISAIMSKNELVIKSTSPISNFIKENNLNDREILVYNTRLPSISFDLQKPIVSLYDGDTELNREVQFETNLNWKNNLLNLQEDTGTVLLKNKLEKSTVIIIPKDGIPEHRKWILNGYSQQEKLGNWLIYY